MLTTLYRQVPGHGIAHACQLKAKPLSKPRFEFTLLLTISALPHPAFDLRQSLPSPYTGRGCFQG